MTLRERVWGLALGVLRPLLPAAGLLGPKAAAASAGRRGAAASLERWARSAAPGVDRLLWLHGASAGELLGAAPVVGRLRDRRALDLLVTYASPSAEAALPSLSPRGAEFAPLDTPSSCRRAVEAVGPSALVFARNDLWPNLSAAAAGAGVPVGMINATVAPDSTRLRPGVRTLLRPGYGRLRRVGAATGGDAARLRSLGVPAEAVEVTGDAAVDRALEEAGAGSPPGPARRLARLAPGGRAVLVAGSTWPADEELLVEALARLRAPGGAAGGSRGGRTEGGSDAAPAPPFLVLVPHEPGPEAGERVRTLCRERLGAPPATWSGGAEDAAGRGAGDGDGSGADVLLVNRTGLLSRLYPAADLAWVGGGLGDDGLHSVVEPAAAGVPVLFGPRGSRWEARALLDRGAAWRLPEGAGPEALADAVAGLLSDGDRFRSAGEAARAFAEENAGAAERGAALVAELLDARA